MYHYLVAPATAWFLAHVIKFTAAAFRGEVNFAWFWRSGGMPSAHSATVVALIITVGAIDGFGSALFGIATVFSAIVIYDSFGIRQAVGNHSKLLEQLRVASHLGVPVKETLGHTSTEVIGGVVLGAIVGVSYTTDQWAQYSQPLTAPLTPLELTLAGALVITCFVASIFLNFRRVGKSVVRKQLKRTINYSLTIPALIATIFILAAQQTIQGLSWRVWIWSLLVLVIVLQLILAVRFYRHLPERLKQESLAYNRQKSKRNQRKRKR